MDRLPESRQWSTGALPRCRRRRDGLGERGGNCGRLNIQGKSRGGGSDLDRFSRQDATSLSTYLAILRRRGWIVVLCGVVAAVVAYELSSRQPAQYTSSADVYVNQQDIASALTGINSFDYSSAALAVDTQASLADVPAVAARALKLAKLHDRSPDDTARPGRRSRPTRRRTSSPSRSSTAHPSPRRCSRPPTRARSPPTATSLSSKPIVKARREVEALMATAAGRGPQGLGAVHQPRGEGPAAADAADAPDLEARSSSGRPVSASRSRRTRSGTRRSG